MNGSGPAAAAAAAAVPSQTTKAWLESLPRPPGATDCSPRSASDWQLAEQWRVLIEAIEILGRAQRWRIDASRRQSDSAQPRTPLDDDSGDDDDDDCQRGALVESHPSLRAPPASAQAATAAFSVPALFSAIQELEDSVMTLRLEVEEASKLQHGLESELELRTLGNSGNLSRPRKIAEGKAELQRSLNSAAQLDKKADEYRQRLAHLQQTITAQLSRQSSVTGGASTNEVQALVSQNAEYERLRAQEATLVNKLSSFGQVAPDPAVPPKSNTQHKKEQVRPNKSGRR